MVPVPQIGANYPQKKKRAVAVPDGSDASCWRIPNGLCEVISGTKQPNNPAIQTTWVTRKSSDFHRI